MLCTFTLDGKPFQVEVEGEFFRGEDQVLFRLKDNVIEHCPWVKEGYGMIRIFSPEEFADLKENIRSLLIRILKETGIATDDKFTPESYHHYVKSDKDHQRIIEKTRALTLADFKIDPDMLVRKFSEAVGKKLQRENPLLKDEIVIMRVNRPSSLDINPFHRDGYLDIWKDILNIWIPVAGCSPESSLPVLPGSHFWNEKDILRTQAKGARINGATYHVPAVVSYKDGLHAVRPNPPYGSALIFTPFLLHGAALNRQEDITRVSLELRLYYSH